MKKENIIDFTLYRDHPSRGTTGDQSISDELKTAIQNLIHRLRELGPIQHSK